MLAFGLAILLLAFWVILGLAVLSLLDHQSSHSLRTLLVAPVVGVAVTLVSVFTLNRLGIPIGQFGLGLAIGLFVAAIGVLWRTKLKLNWRDYAPFVGIFLLAFCLTGWPLLKFGFDWASYGNADMTTYYVQSAQRFLHHGFFEPPGTDFTSGRDYSFDTWFIQIKGHRVGGELLLAWVTSLVGLTPVHTAMPLLVALNVALISVTGGLVCDGKHGRVAALLTCGLLSVSALTTLSVLQQLLAQVLGIGLLIGCIILLARPFAPTKRWVSVRYGVLVGVLVAALFVAYQEVFPFLVAVLLLYVAIGVWRKQSAIKPMLPMLVIVCITALALLRGYFISFIQYSLFFTTDSRMVEAYGLEQADLNRLIFPHLFVPSALSMFWGITDFSVLGSEPWLSLSIILGGVLLLFVAVAAVRQAWSGQPIGIITVIMLALGGVLFIRTTDYGLNKLSMVIQPFLFGSFAVAIPTLLQIQAVRIIPLVLLAVLNFSTQQGYMQTSIDSGNAFVEIPKATQSRLYSELKNLVDSMSSQHLAVETSNFSLSGVLSIFTRGKATTFVSEPSRSFNLTSLTDAGGQDSRSFDLHDPQNATAKNQFNFFESQFKLTQAVMGQKDAMLLSMQPQQGLFNRWHYDANSETNFDLRPLGQVTNFLAFNRSRLGPHYFSSINERFVAAFYKLERDVAFKGRSMAALGQHLLFRVINPSPAPRFTLSISNSYASDGSNELPPVAAIGTERQLFPIIGRGSARVFSAPLNPQLVDEVPYLGIDLGREGKAFDVLRTGLMQLYGRRISLDPRAVVAFGRDISLISEQDYTALVPPTQLKTFPDDLGNKNLEYSGLYEDGWVSEAAFVSLSQTNETAALRIQGMVPAIGDQSFTTEVTIAIDGKPVGSQLLKLGDFDIQLPVPPKAQRQRVDLRFSQLQSLPGGDKRPVAAKLKFIGFVN